MSLPKYPDYKPSRLDTKAHLPSSWSEAPIKRAFEVVSGSTPKTDNEEFWDGEIAWVTPADLSGLGAVEVTESKRTITKTGLLSCGTTLVPSGSIVISTRAPIGTLAIAGKELCTNQGCKVLVPNSDCSSRFAYYYLSVCTEQLNVKGRGTTFLELSGDELGGFLMPMPDPVEQKLICTVLDRETAKIDALIAEQQRLIDLLQEKRRAVISHAVTKGLNPNAPMKVSGVEWLGEVPEHWLTTQLGKLCVDVADGPHYSPSYVEDGVPFLSARNIKQDRWDFADLKYVSGTDCDEFDKRVVPAVGDVLYTKGGTTGVARVVDFPERFQVWVHVAVLKLRKSVADPRFIAYALNSIGCYEQSQLFTRGATNQDLGLTRMILIQLALPPLEEQKEISSRLDSQTKSIGDLLSKVEASLRLLEERRSSLISAAVTGQIDVRGLVPEAAEQ